MTRVRYREDVGWEMRCDDCKRGKRNEIYWPLLPVGEFWNPLSPIRCRACERTRLRHARRSVDALKPRDRRTANQKARVRYYANRERILARHREVYQANREAVLAKRREAYYSHRRVAVEIAA